MQRKAKRTIPAREEEYVAEILCDICGTSKEGGVWGDNWARGYDINEVNISRRTGSQWPEGGNGEKIEFDICPRCMDEKVIPFLESIGAKPRKQDWES